MKKFPRAFAVICLTFLAVTASFAQSVGLDDAITLSAKKIAGSLTNGTRVAVLNCTSDYSFVP